VSRGPRVKAGSSYAGAGALVYVLECNGLYKIGFSCQPRQRVAAIQTSNPFPVVLVGTVEGGRAVEYSWHTHFHSKRVTGEWFALTEADVALILASDEHFESPHEENWSQDAHF